MRKPAGQSACRRKYASSFRFELREGRTQSVSPLPKGEATWWARSHCTGWTRNAQRLILRVEYNARHTPGYCLLLRDVSQTRDVAYLPANHRSETMRSGRDCAETRKCRALPV